MTANLVADPDDPNVLIAPLTNREGTYRIELGEDGDSWCLMCEALDPKDWRFTEEQAARLNWLICDDHVDLIGAQLDTVVLDDDDPMVMDIPSAD